MDSSSIPKFISNPTIVENIKLSRPVFKIIPQIAKKDDSIGTFSKIRKGVAYTEEPRICIHCNIEELGSEDLLNMFRTVICDENGIAKPEHKIIETLGFVEILNIPEFLEEVVRIVLSRAHGEFIWLDSVTKLTQQAIRVVTGLPSTGSRPNKTKKVPNNTVKTLSGATSDSRSLRINHIKDIIMRFISMILGYKTTHANILNSVSSLCINSAYEMVNNNAKIDVCVWLKDELIDILKKIKGDKNGTISFGNLLVCLRLYFTKEIPGIGLKDFGYDISIGKKLQEAFTSMGTAKDSNISEYLKKFQAKMKTRERLPQSVVHKYDKEIYFVIKKDETWMEVVLPRTIWVTEMGYEADVNIIETYAKALLEAPREPIENVFGSA